MYDYESEHEQEIFEYLDELRENGEINMFGAGTYVQDDFELTRHQANRFTTKWMHTFSERYPE